jgi:mono/diheme cytochrome c family protein
MRIIVVIVAVALLAAPAFAADAAAGKAIYEKKCASCHGAGGEGKDAIAKMLKVELRHLGSKEVQAKPDAELMKNSKDGTGKMKPVALADKEAQDVVSFLRTLKK